MIYIQHDHLRYYSSAHLEVSTDLTGEQAPRETEIKFLKFKTEIN